MCGSGEDVVGDDALKGRTSFRIGDRSNEKLKSAPSVKGSIVFRAWLDDIRKKRGSNFFHLFLALLLHKMSRYSQRESDEKICF